MHKRAGHGKSCDLLRGPSIRGAGLGAHFGGFYCISGSLRAYGQMIVYHRTDFKTRSTPSKGAGNWPL